MTHALASLAPHVASGPILTLRLAATQPLHPTWLTALLSRSRSASGLTSSTTWMCVSSVLVTTRWRVAEEPVGTWQRGSRQRRRGGLGRE
jgi:hypothetical protein